MSSRQLDQLAYFLNEVPSLQAPDLGEEMQSQLLILRASLAVFRYNLPEAIFYARQA